MMSWIYAVALTFFFMIFLGSPSAIATIGGAKTGSTTAAGTGF